MEHSRRSNHPSKLDVANLERGDIVLCDSFASPAMGLSDIEHGRVALVTPLHTRSDLERLLRGLLLHPNIRHIVVCGDDRNATGEALLALWQQGLDENGQIPGSRGRLSVELDAGSLDALLRDVEIWDRRGQSIPEIAGGFQALLPRRPERSPRSVPEPEIPARKVFLSRKTTFPIFSSDIGDSWLQLLNLALRIGTEKVTGDGERMAEALNAVITLETPLLEDGELEKETEEFQGFLDFNRDDFDRRYFPRYVECLLDRNGVDQLEALCDRLRRSLDTCSATLVVHESDDPANSTFAPSLISATFNVVDQKLFGSFVLRSCDLYTSWPLEATALARLQRETAENLGIESGSTTFVIHSAHLYERDWDRSERVLENSFKRPLPLHVDPSGVFLFGNDGGNARAMLLDHDASTIFWEEAFSNPEDLSWYIVDVMPWLLPQHIRYVGQECAALMRAMQEGECYLQG